MTSLLESAGRLAARAGKGLLAGAIATGAMTVSSTLEMKLRGREASSAPATAAGRVLGVQPRDPEGARRFGTFVHWAYGTGWGGVGGALRAMPVGEPVATVAHLASLWGTEAAMLPALEVTPPIKEWGAKEIAIDVFHHLVYAAAFAGVWFLLRDRDRTNRSVLSSLRSLAA